MFDVLSSFRLREDEPGREGSDDRREPDEICGRGECDGNDDRIDGQCAPRLHVANQTHEEGSQPDTCRKSHGQEDDRLCEQPPDRREGDAASLGNGGHDAEDDQAENVVHNGSPKDDPGTGILQPPEVRQHAGRDTDARCGQSGPDKHGHDRRIAKRVHDAVARGEPRYDADRRDERRLRPRAQQVAEI
jgi:hypothetical protein